LKLLNFSCSWNLRPDWEPFLVPEIRWREWFGNCFYENFGNCQEMTGKIMVLNPQYLMHINWQILLKGDLQVVKKSLGPLFWCLIVFMAKFF
jgi:hypothetical protein